MEIQHLAAIVQQRLADGDRIDREINQAVAAKRSRRLSEIVAQVVQEAHAPATLVDAILRILCR